MPSWGSLSRRLLTGPAIVALLALGLGLLAPSTTRAANGQIRLALLPIGQAGSFFDLSMTAGQSRTFQVEIANNGDGPIGTRTYAADVYTIINGGFGAQLRDAPRTGTTTWLDYPAAVLQLAAGQGVRRSFTVAVPADAGPGEYISSLVLENSQPIADGSTLGINQIVRQAVAVVVTVPGRRSPGLVIGTATSKAAAGSTTIDVAVANTGNIRLKPLVGFTLADASGVEISRMNVQMDTFYAHTNTLVEFPLAALLAPGAYRVGLTLADRGQGAQVQASGIVLVVAGPAPTTPPQGGLPGPIAAIQGPAGGPATASLALAAGLPVTLLVVLLLLLIRRHRGTRASA